jgi:hypothetical protein
LLGVPKDPAPVPPGAPVERTGAASAPKGRRSRWPVVGWVTIGVATAAGVTAAALAWRASALSSEIGSALSRDHQWSSHLESLENEGRRDARWGAGFAAGSLVAGAAGAALLISLPSSASPGNHGRRGHALVGGALLGYAAVF